MVCYICQHKTEVLNSRLVKRTNQVWRRRHCAFCDALVTTTESIDMARALLVVQPGSKRYQPFERDRLFLSLYKSLGHRPTALTDAGALCATIIAKVAPRAQDGIMRTSQIVETTIVALNRFDALAAQHYQAFHKL